MIPYRFAFRPYRRRFVRWLSTSHGTWNIREGIILRLTDEMGYLGWGEIAPLPWFGSETWEQALDFCRQLPAEITEETIFSIPTALPACQFGFESAWETVRGRELNASNPDSHSPPPSFSPSPHLPLSGLLPAGEAALHQWQTLWQQGYRTFKWKIGVYPIADELEIFHLLARSLPASAKLRLDANGGLSYDRANSWLWTCDNVRANDRLPLEIEFIEQPLPVEQFQEMRSLSSCYTTPIALDESTATLNQLEACDRQGWQGIFVIKPAIAGSPSQLRQFCQQRKIDAVFSSVFETEIGRRAALHLAAELSRGDRAVGFGVNQWFAENDRTWLKNLWKDF